MKKTLLASMLFGALFSMSAQASQPVDLENLPEILKIANQTRGWQILHKFETESTMTGWVVNTGNGRQIAYTDPKGYLVLGELVTPSGDSLNQKYLAENQDDIDFEALLSEATFIDLSKKDGKDKEAVIVLYEPFCPYCSAIYAAMKPYIDAGYPVKLLPVGFLSDGTQGRPKSADLIYALITAADPVAAVEQHEKKEFQMPNGIFATAEFNAKVQKNFEIMNNLDIQGTPAVLVPNGKEYRIIRNMVGMNMLPEIFGTERMDSDDPRLAQFGADPKTYPVKK